MPMSRVPAWFANRMLRIAPVMRRAVHCVNPLEFTKLLVHEDHPTEPEVPVSPSRWTKMLQRRVMVSWRSQPNRYDIEAMQANIERVGLVIRVRWALVIALTVFSVLAGWAYSLVIPAADLAQNMAIPALALVFVLGYNIFYWKTYRRLGNIAVLNQAQLVFDALVVTLLVYYSGGAHSWFWAMYSLFILEAAFILPKRWHTWAIAGFCLGALGFVVWGSYFGLMPQIAVPFITTDLHGVGTFVFVRYLWQVTVLCGTATVATLMTAALRQREAQLAASSVIDDKTGLYDRAYFLRLLTSEIARAERDGRSIGVLLLDIDDFDRYNRSFGIERGDRMLKALAEKMTEVTRSHSRSDAGVNIVSRWGGEEFAILLAENALGGDCKAGGLRIVADDLCTAATELRVEGAGVTVSIGVACYPEDGSSVDDLLTAADEALLRSADRGGNSASLASDLTI